MPKGLANLSSSTAPYLDSIDAIIRSRQSSKSTAQRRPSRTTITSVPTIEEIWSVVSRIRPFPSVPSASCRLLYSRRDDSRELLSKSRGVRSLPRRPHHALVSRGQHLLDSRV